MFEELEAPDLDTENEQNRGCNVTELRKENGLEKSTILWGKILK